MQSSSTSSPSRTVATVVACALLAVGTYHVIQEWLGAWFSYGTYSALFTYGAIGIPAIFYLTYSKAKALSALPNPWMYQLLGLAFVLLGCGLGMFSPLKDIRFAGVFVAVVGVVIVQWGLFAPRLLWQELALFLLVIPFPIVFAATHNSFFQGITAHGAAFMLWYGGIPAFSDGVFININELQNGALHTINGVQVAETCSGTAIGFTLTYLGFLIPVLLPVGFNRRLVLSMIGPAMAITFNTMRVAFLLYVKTYVSEDAFAFWHEGNGRLIYSFSTMLVYGIIALIVIWPSLQPQAPRSMAKQKAI
ncbi:MAG: exosortase/archaeosortase family protein [Anaerolineae bacterium]|nr:exosortase/archaeosortase family protein [Gloeobacterales cyanobacterium ES-bin-313]